MGPCHRPEIFKTSLEKKFHRRNSIKEHPDSKHLKQAIVGKVFVQQEEIVAEIQVGFSPGDLWKGASANVEYGGEWAIHDFISIVLEAPAKINLLHVGKEIVIQPAHFMKNIGLYKHACAGCPKYFTDFVILTMILFNGLENSSTAKGIAVFINEPTGSSGVFKFFRFVERPDFWLAGGDHLILLHQFNNRGNPVFSDLNIRIQQDVVVSIYLPEGKIISPGKAFVGWILNNLMPGWVDFKNETESSDDALSATMISAASLLYWIRVGKNCSRYLLPFQFNMITATRINGKLKIKNHEQLGNIRSYLVTCQRAKHSPP